MQGSPSDPGADEAPPSVPSAPDAPSAPEPAGDLQDKTGQFEKLRRNEWLLLAGAAIAAVPLWLWRGNDIGPGAVIEAPLSLITADKHELSCALPVAIGKYRCAFRAPDQGWPEPLAPADTLTQYLTTDRRLMLVAGLFEEPNVAARYASEPPQGKRLSKLRRFIATCKLRLVQKVPSVHTHWSKHGNWDESGAAWVAEPIGCTTRDE